MPRNASEPAFDLFSYARRGPGRRDRWSPAEIAQVARTVGRAPEVMVKVLSRGATNLAAVRKHLDYIDRKGRLDLVTDDGRRIQGRDAAEDLLTDWDLDLDEHRRSPGLGSTVGKAPRLVHKLVFSMPPGTPPERVLGAVRNFCREEFELRHRYAMVMHTDEPHPHVHVVVKSLSEDGVRLNIRKDVLRKWRQQFAVHLRALGVEANATPRVVRGETRSRPLDAIYRAQSCGDSRHVRDRVEAIADAMRRGERITEPGRAQMLKTRQQIEQGWLAVRAAALENGQPALAERIREFVSQMTPPKTDRERIADELRRYLERAPNQERPR
jgi:MobA/VirD2-like, nuclease domain